MKKIQKILCLASLVTVAFTNTACGKKTPDKGYLTDEEVIEVIRNFDKNVNRSKYTLSGEVNYFAIKEVERKQNTSKSFTPITNVYDRAGSSSYYLQVPMNLTFESWTSEEIDDKNLPLNTKYNLENKIITTAVSYSKCYYYKTSEGGLKIKTFAENKAVKIKKPTNIECRAKWNITIEYDKYGYLVEENFATINSYKEADSETCYGKGTYTYDA